MTLRPDCSIEFGEQNLKLVAVKPGASGPGRLVVAVKPLGSLNDTQIVTLIAELLKEHRLKPRSLLLSVARSQTTLWNLGLPAQDAAELKQMVELNVARIVPEKKDQVIYSYRVFGRDERGYSKVMISIAQRDVLKRYLALIELAGLFTESIVLSSSGVFAMAVNRHRHELKTGAVYVHLEIDTQYVDMIIFSTGEMLYSRSINLDAKQLENDEGIKKLIGEIRQSMVIFHNEEGNLKPESMYVGGALVNGERVCALLQAELGMTVKRASLNIPGQESLMETVSLTAPVEFVSGRPNDKHLEFVTPELEVRKSLRRETRLLVMMGVGFIYLCMVLAAVFFTRYYFRSEYCGLLSAGNQKIIGSLGDTLQKSHQVAFFKENLKQRTSPLFVVGYLLKNLPQDIALKYVSFDKDKNIVLKGETHNISDIYKFVSILEQSGFYKEVKTKSTRKRKIRDREITDFELIFVFVPRL